MKKSSIQRKARRVALWLLYAIDVSDGAADEALDAARGTLDEMEDELPAYWDEVERRVRGAYEKREEIDAIVQAVSPRWRIDRMALIDRNILRLGVWEILYGELPPVPVIDACVDLGKEYGSESTGGFVNGLLDQIRRDHDVAVR